LISDHAAVCRARGGSAYGHDRRIRRMTTMIVPVQETEPSASSRLVLSPEDAARLNVRSGQRVYLAVTVVADEESEPAAKLRAAIEELDRGEGMIVSDSDRAAIRHEIEELDRQHATGGTSPTLERLIREHDEKVATTRASRA